MRIYALSHVLALPFVGAFAIILYISLKDSNYDLSYWLLPLVLVLTMIYIFAPQINFWWFQRSPPPLDQKIVNWLQVYSTFYKNLEKSEQHRFETRLSIFIEGKDFFSMGSEKTGMPYDIKAILAHQAIILTFYRDDYMFNNYERLVLYKHPFPSPKCQFLHTVETEHEDGVLLWSMEHAIPGLTHKVGFYNIVLHAFIDAFLYRNPSLELPKITEDHIPQLELISGFNHDRLLKLTGFSKLNPLIIGINYFFCFSEKFKQFLPAETEQLKMIFYPKIFIPKHL